MITIPSGRQTLDSHNAAKTFNWTLKAPKGKVLQSIKIRARNNVTGTPGSAAYFHKLFKEIKLRGKAGTMLTALEDAIPMTAVLSHAKREDNHYEAAPGTTDIVRNPSMAAAATDYDCVLDFHCPAPGTEFVLSVEMKKIVDVLTWATGAAFDIIATAKWTTYRGQKQYAIQGNVHSSVTEKQFNGVIGAALCADAEWTTLLGSMKIGEALTSDQVFELEDLTNDNLRGLAADSSGATRTTPVADPADAAVVYVVSKELEAPGAVELNLNASSTILSILFKEDGGF
jgi:hypothetical protein